MKNGINTLVGHLLKFRQKGVQVYANGVDFANRNLNPNNMADNKGILLDNIKPFKMSEQRKRDQ